MHYRICQVNEVCKFLKSKSFSNCRVCGGFQPVYNGGGGGYQNGIHRRMDVEDVDNEVETNSLDLTEAADNLVRKRRAPYQGAHVGQGGCNKIPQQKCNKIPHKQPRRQCSTVDKPSCHSSPRQVKTGHMISITGC